MRTDADNLIPGHRRDRYHLTEEELAVLRRDVDCAMVEVHEKKLSKLYLKELKVREERVVALELI